MKNALTRFHNVAKVQRTLKDDILELIQHISSKYDWDVDSWMNKERSVKIAMWESTIENLCIKVEIKVSNSHSMYTPILTDNQVISYQDVYELYITITGDTERPLIRELKEWYERTITLNPKDGKDGIQMAKVKLAEVEMFLINKGKDSEVIINT